MKELLERLATEIRPLNYVVQRNWENLPDDFRFDGHFDLDLFVSEEDKPALEKILLKYPEIPVDVRSASDDYYPASIAEVFLTNRREYGGFWIPCAPAAFVAIYYHSVFHKKDNPYADRLKKLFAEVFPPVKAKDPGVGFYYDPN